MLPLWVHFWVQCSLLLQYEVVLEKLVTFKIVWISGCKKLESSTFLNARLSPTYLASDFEYPWICSNENTRYVWHNYLFHHLLSISYWSYSEYWSQTLIQTIIRQWAARYYKDHNFNVSVFNICYLDPNCSTVGTQIPNIRKPNPFKFRTFKSSVFEWPKKLATSLGHFI